MQVSVQRSKVLFELLTVLPPCHSVGAGRRVLLQRQERGPKPIEGDVVKQRSEPFVFGSFRSLTHTDSAASSSSGVSRLLS
jgi:hypothetical protein